MQSLSERVLGVREDMPNRVVKAARHVTGYDITADAIFGQRIKDREGRVASHDEYQELRLVWYSLVSLLQTKTPRNINPLLNWHQYADAFRRLDRVTEQDDTRYALQLGCYTALSAAAFTALCQDVYDAYPISVDLTSSPSRSGWGGFVQSDVLRLGIASDSINIAQTSSLLRMLEGPAGSTLEQNTLQCLREAQRVLKPGGYLIMHETTPDIELPDDNYDCPEWKAYVGGFKAMVKESLARAGFDRCDVRPGTMPYTTDFLFDPERDFTKQEKYGTPETFVVTAQKPRDSTRA